LVISSSGVAGRQIKIRSYVRSSILSCSVSQTVSTGMPAS
jgi:hypothetical protein